MCRLTEVVDLVCQLVAILGQDLGIADEASWGNVVVQTQAEWWMRTQGEVLTVVDQHVQWQSRGDVPLSESLD
jgi:hypothetical protein